MKKPISCAHQRIKVLPLKAGWPVTWKCLDCGAERSENIFRNTPVANVPR